MGGKTPGRCGTMNDARWHRKSSEVRWPRRSRCVCVGEITFKLNSRSALSAAVRGDDAHCYTITETLTLMRGFFLFYMSHIPHMEQRVDGF